MQYSKFAVDETPWCVWDWELQNQNLNFIESVDPHYFTYLARLFAHSEDDQEHSAALALRSAYSHGLETLFAFLFASLQAPDCVIGWLHKYEIYNLKNLLKKVGNRQLINTKVNLSSISWQNIADGLLLFSLDDKDKEKRIKQKFAFLWKKLAEDYLGASFTPEYNSIKHGFRAKSGGFWVAFGREDVAGVPAPADHMHLFGKTEFGSTFFEVVPLDKGKHNFRLLKHSRGWKLERFYFGLHLISDSLQNILSFLKIANGVDPSSVEFVWASPESLFDEPWKEYPNLSGISMNSIIEPEHITPFNNDEILSIYKTGSDKTK